MSAKWTCFEHKDHGKQLKVESCSSVLYSETTKYFHRVYESSVKKFILSTVVNNCSFYLKTTSKYFNLSLSVFGI